MRLPRFALLGLLVLAAAPAATGAPSPAGTGAGAADPACDDRDPFDPAALRDRVARLAAPALDGRAPGTPGDAAARGYLAAEFACAGLVPAGDAGTYTQAFVAGGHPTANLVGYLPGGDAARDILVIGAHHDHLGDGHLGANDDASGIAALIAIARALHRAGTPRRTIAFVAFGGEELGELGSRHFAGHPPAALPLDRVVYDINLDMVGSYSSAGAVYAMGTFRGLPATAIVRALATEQPALHVGVGGHGLGSDHEAFCGAGVPYVFFWTPDRRCYHERCDTTAQLDTAHLAAIARLAGSLVTRLSDAPADLAASRARLGCGG